MKQQDILRLAMRRSGQTRAQLAEALGVARRTLDKWLLPEGSSDFRAMPETAWRLLAHQYGLRKSDGLSMPYDWSNPAMPRDAMIVAVLRRANFADIVRVCNDFGFAAVRARLDAALTLAPDAERPMLARILARMLRSIEIAFAGHTAA